MYSPPPEAFNNIFSPVNLSHCAGKKQEVKFNDQRDLPALASVTRSVGVLSVN